MSGPNGCNAAITIAGAHYWCDLKAGHHGWPHGNTEAEVIWRGSSDEMRAIADLAEEHRRWAVINRDLADRMESPEADYHIGMAHAQESTCRHLRAAIKAT